MLRVTAVTLLLLVATDVAAEPCFATLEEYGDWIQTYYREPDPERLPCSLQFYAGSDLFRERGSRMRMASFYAALLRAQPDALDALFEAVTRSSSINARVLALQILWLTDTDQSRARLRQAPETWGDPRVEAVAAQLATAPPRDALAGQLSRPQDIDGLWAAFFATGDATPVEVIAAQLDLLDDPGEPRRRIGRAAEMSLEAVARDDTRVRGLLSDLTTRSDGLRRSRLREILLRSAPPAVPEAGPGTPPAPAPSAP